MIIIKNPNNNKILNILKSKVLRAIFILIKCLKIKFIIIRKKIRNNLMQKFQNQKKKKIKKFKQNKNKTINNKNNSKVIYLINLQFFIKKALFDV